jgi:methionyl-tRNA formyltransferase
MTKPKIIFMGTPDFAVPTMEAIHSKWGITAVVTVPDKPQGRGRKLVPSPVKAKALELGLPVLQPEKLKDPEFEQQISELDADIICVVAFRILPRQIYTKSKIGTFNIHGSLLPKYRGAAPINHAIINGDKKSGVTSFLLQDIVDTGDMLLRREVEIPDGSTAGDLHDMLMPESAALAVATIDLLLSGDFKALQQDDTQATPAPKIFREDIKINWNTDAPTLRNYIHGMSPVPGAWTMWGDKSFKILKCSLAEDLKLEPGEFICKDNSIYAQAVGGSLKLEYFQLQGKKALACEDFMRGYRGEESGKFE